MRLSCEWCGAEFRKTAPGHRFCCRSCKEKWNWANRPEELKDEMWRSYYQLTDEERAEMDLPPRKPGKIPCLTCGRLFDSWDVRSNRRCYSCRRNTANWAKETEGADA